MTLEAFADVIVPGEKRGPDDRAIAGTAAGGGAAAAGVLAVLESPEGGLAEALPDFAAGLDFPPGLGAILLTHGRPGVHHRRSPNAPFPASFRPPANAGSTSSTARRPPTAAPARAGKRLPRRRAWQLPDTRILALSTGGRERWACAAPDLVVAT
jgi:hypothetical protein